MLEDVVEIVEEDHLPVLLFSFSEVRLSVFSLVLLESVRSGQLDGGELHDPQDEKGDDE